MNKKLIFLKLGGSLITDKNVTNTANLECIDTIAHEIALALHENDRISLLIGHGSGSFGHHAANKYQTREGVQNSEQWRGFAEVAERARELNQIMIERFLHAGLNAVSISPFSCLLTENREVVAGNTQILKNCLRNNIIPVVYGDVVFDRKMGGTILSTEDVFSWLAVKLRPQQILLAGFEDGVWEDYPHRTHLLPEINPQGYLAKQAAIQASGSTDVTGGMRSKVESMVSLISKLPGLEVQIFSGKHPGNIYSVLLGLPKGTIIRNPKG